MKTFEVIGKNLFKSGKTGKEYSVIYTNFEVENPGEGMKGKMCKDYFVPRKMFENIEIGDNINLYFNENGYVEDYRLVD